MIKSITAKLSLLFLLIAITTCYYERDIDEELEICFVRSGDIWIMNIDGSNQKQITFLSNDGSPSWSPDGEKIIFHSSRNGQNEIFLINPDGSGLKKLASAAGHLTYPTWSSDGENIVFSGTTTSGVFVLISDNDGQILQSFPQNEQVAYPVLSPDDNYLYFSALYTPFTFYRINLKTSIQENIGPANYSSLSFSPDGKTLACAKDPSIYLIPISDLSNYDSYPPLTEGFYPCWAPDGKTIVYIYNSNIYSINIDGINIKQLTTSGDCSMPCVKWKPK